MALCFKNQNGEIENVKIVTFKGQDVKQIRYGNIYDCENTVWCKPYTLTIEPNVGIRNVKVTRTASDEPTASLEELKNGDVIYHGDTLSCEIIPMPGFIQPDTPTIHIVEGDTNITRFLSVEPKQYSLNVTYGNGVKSVTVTRQSSPYKGAKTGSISLDAPIYYNDIIYISAEPDTGYELENDLITYSVSGNIVINITAQVKTYRLNYTAGIGVQQLSFTRQASPYGGRALGDLQSGALVCYGDIIQAKATAETGYIIKNLPQYTVDKNISVTVSAELKTFTLTISKQAGVKHVKVKRTYSQNANAIIGDLGTGAKLYYGDSIDVDAEPEDGFVLDKNYKYSSSVYANMVINPIATRRTYTLTKCVNEGVASVTVTRTFNAATNSYNFTTLNSGDTIYHGDAISVSATPKTGYSLNSYTKSITVIGPITISPTAYLTPYKLTITQDANIASVKVNRASTNKVGASTGSLANNADIYYGDKLLIAATAANGYKVSTITVNGTSFLNGNAFTVSGNVSIYATSTVKDKAPILKSISGTNTYSASGKSFTMRGTVENSNNFAVTAVMYINGRLYDTRNIAANGYTTFQSYEDGTTYTTATLRVIFNNSSEMTSTISITPSDFHPQISAGRS